MLATTTLATRSRYPSRPGRRCMAAAACAAILLASMGTARADNVSVGTVFNFENGSNFSNPTGTWSVGDKSFTFLGQSGFSTSAGGSEDIKITSSPSNTHSFLLDNLTLFGQGNYTLSYRVDVLPASPQYVLADVELDSAHLSNNTVVTKDVYSTLDLFTAAGNGNLAHLVSTNGGLDGPASLLGLSHVWVRDTIAIDATGQLSSVTNNFSQTPVPEIDATSLAGAFPLLVGGLALLERRRRKPAGEAAPAGS